MKLVNICSILFCISLSLLEIETFPQSVLGSRNRNPIGGRTGANSGSDSLRGVRNSRPIGSNDARSNGLSGSKRTSSVGTRAKGSLGSAGLSNSGSNGVRATGSISSSRTRTRGSSLNGRRPAGINGIRKPGSIGSAGIRSDSSGKRPVGTNGVQTTSSIGLSGIRTTGSGIGKRPVGTNGIRKPDPTDSSSIRTPGSGSNSRRPVGTNEVRKSSSASSSGIRTSSGGSIGKRPGGTNGIRKNSSGLNGQRTVDKNGVQSPGARIVASPTTTSENGSKIRPKLPLSEIDPGVKTVSPSIEPSQTGTNPFTIPTQTDRDCEEESSSRVRRAPVRGAPVRRAPQGGKCFARKPKYENVVKPKMNDNFKNTHVLNGKLGDSIGTWEDIKDQPDDVKLLSDEDAKKIGERLGKQKNTYIPKVFDDDGFVLVDKNGNEEDREMVEIGAATREFNGEKYISYVYVTKGKIPAVDVEWNANENKYEGKAYKAVQVLMTTTEIKTERSKEDNQRAEDENKKNQEKNKVINHMIGIIDPRSGDLIANAAANDQQKKRWEDYKMANRGNAIDVTRL